MHVDRQLMEDRTPNGSIDRELKYKIHSHEQAVTHGWTVDQCRMISLLDEGYSQVEVGRLIGVSISTIESWLRMMRGRGKERG